MSRNWPHDQPNPADDAASVRLADDRLSRRLANVAMLLGDCMRTREGSGFDQARASEAIRFAIQVIGGEPASAGEFAECCIVGQALDGRFRWFASGVLVAPNRVVTANHVAATGREPDVVALPTNGIDIDASIIVKARFIAGPSDLAVLELERGLQIDPIRIASASDVEAATVTTVVGFGSNQIGRTLMDQKRHADLDIDRASRTATEFAAGRSGKGACEGDSGGPAYIRVDGRRVLAGITSRPQVSEGRCGEQAMFVRADAHRNFILGL